MKPPTHLFLEMHFPEPIDDGEDAMEEMPTWTARDALGNAIGTTHIIAIEYPEPNIVRLELELADLVLTGVDYSENEDFET